MRDSDSRPHFVSIVRAAGLLGIGRTKLYELIQRGTLHPVKLGQRSVVSTKELAAFASRLEEEAGILAESGRAEQ